MQTAGLAVSHAEMTWHAYLTSVIADGGTIIKLGNHVDAWR